ncbi:MAG: hypothetical protein NTV49_11210 [Kiritimatiellaeota bacterium]|nr:hypothetical protein [Kiritimatiellota bacterium]
MPPPGNPATHPPRGSVARRAAGVAAALVLSGLGACFFGAFHRSITGFYRIGDVRPPPPALAGRDAMIYPRQAGYDGQYFLVLALDPWLRQPGTTAALDHPQYRCRRLLFPLLGRLAALGQPAAVPYALPLLNALAAILLVWVAARYLERGGASGWNALFMLGILGVWEVLMLTTADLLASLCLVATLYALRCERPATAALTLALACLTREVMLLVWLVLLAVSLPERRWRRWAWLLTAAAPAAAWNLYVLSTVPPGVGQLGERLFFQTPLAAVTTTVARLAAGGWGAKNLFEIYAFALLPLALIALLAAASLARRRPEARLIGGYALLLAVMFGTAMPSFFCYYIDYNRVFMDVYILLVLSLAFTPWRRLTQGVLALASVAAAAYAAAYAAGLI